jgi:pimeloyl-ACP methyl ester carboxylesterase
VTWVVAILAVLVLPLAVEWSRTPVTRRRRAGVPGEIVALPGGLTHVVREGPEDGPPVILIHGITTPSYVWAGIAPILAGAGYRVIRYDLFGRGLSDRPPGRQDIGFFLDQLDALILREEIGAPCALIGYSMGGAIAAAKAAVAPEDVSALALVAPVGLQPARVPVLSRLPVIGDWVMWVAGGRLLVRRLRALVREPSAIADYHAREALETRTRGFPRSVLSALRRTVARDRLAEHAAIARSGMPVLAIWGELDDAVPLASAGRLAEINPHAWQHQVDGVGHSLPHTRPGEVAAEILRFLAARSGGR